MVKHLWEVEQDNLMGKLCDEENKADDLKAIVVKLTQSWNKP